MAYMDSEADLAGVIGHEIGHVTARHGAQRATRAQTAGLGVLAATILGAVLEGRGGGGAGGRRPRAWACWPRPSSARCSRGAAWAARATSRRRCRKASPPATSPPTAA